MSAHCCAHSAASPPSVNDALCNVAVMLSALSVFGTASAWPDLLVAG